MIPITQTKVVIKNSKNEVIQRGNCFAAVVASILEVPITEVPNVEVFYHMDDGYHSEVMLRFLLSKGWELCSDDRFECFHNEMLYERYGENKYHKLRKELKDKYYLVSGKSPRGVSHICIYKNGELVHDPHPTREGLETIEYFETLDKNINPCP